MSDSTATTLPSQPLHTQAAERAAQDTTDGTAAVTATAKSTAHMHDAAQEQPVASLQHVTSESRLTESILAMNERAQDSMSGEPEHTTGKLSVHACAR